MKRKILPIILSMTLCFGASMTAFAADESNGTENGTVSGASQQQHTYVAYQIFTGKYYNTQLSDIEFGSAVKNNNTMKEKLAALLGIDKDAEAKVFAEAIADKNTDAEAVARTIYENLGSATPISVNGDVVADPELGQHGDKYIGGYYLIVDNTQLTGDDAVYLDRAQLQTAGPDGKVVIKEKRSKIEIGKKVRDINDSVEIFGTGWQDSADYDIGDVIPFQLTATVPSDFANYTAYEYIFHDVQDEALVFDAESVVVKYGTLNTDNELENGGTTIQKDATVKLADGTEVPAYEVKTSNIGTDTFQVVLNNLKGLTGLSATDTIVVEYTSTLNGENIKFGNEMAENSTVPGNPNKVRLEFSNSQGGKGQTPWEIAIVFTFKTDIFKVDQDRKPLAGAMFTLEKFIKTADASDYTAENATWNNIALTPSKTGEVENVFSAAGIDDGIYRITETKVPDGFNSWPTKYIKVEVEHTQGDTPEVTKITVYDITDPANITTLGCTDTTLANLGEFTFDGNKSTLDTTIINQKGAILPSTGGIGTTPFYIIGGVLVVGAVVLLIVRRKMRNEE